MSLKVISTSVPPKFPFGDADSNNIRISPHSFYFRALCNIDGEMGYLQFNCYPYLRFNGASNPIGKPIKNYYGDSKKDAPALGHDILYAFGGEVDNLGRRLTAGECDDYLRGAMREAGFSRSDAGIVDFFVRLFAHFRHFGKKYDKELMHMYSRVTWIPTNRSAV